MKIEKINDRVDIPESSDAELRGCQNDCVEYKFDTKAIYNLIREAGYPADGSETVEQIRDIKEVFGAYCYKSVTAKKNIYL